MTGKRFTIFGEWHKDNVIDEIRDNTGEFVTIGRCVDLLNENEQLKIKDKKTQESIRQKDKQISYLITKREDAEYELLHLKEMYEELLEENEKLKQQLADDFNQSNCITVQKSKIKELEKENEQLKQQLYCTDENGVCIKCEHHYLVKDEDAELGYYNLRCKKGHYECAKVSLKHCEDFKWNGDVE